jgi:putative nucleotidyltransferase with HDIG domain
MLRTRVVSGPTVGLVMSLVFAALLTAIHAGDGYVKSWWPRFGQPTQVTLRVPYAPSIVRDLTSGHSRVRYPGHHTIVARGTVLTPSIEAHESAYLFEMARRPPSPERLGGMFVVFFALTMGLVAYLRRFGQSRVRLLRTQVGLLTAMGLLALLAKGVLLFTALPPLWIPMATVPLFVATAYDRRTALIVSLVMAFVIASLLGLDMLVLTVILSRSMAATVFYLDRKHPRQMILSGTLAGLSGAAVYVAMVATFGGRFDVPADLSRLADSALLSCVGGGVAAGLLAVLLRPLAERLLGNVSREHLLELQDLSQPLLEQLALRAPGTFTHSRSIANLAELAASAIGADALLTRVGGYYHDVGKMAQPKYFVENLGLDEPSPHDELDPEVSADAIMAHVVGGAKMLRSAGIPEPLVEFAYTHHGTGLIEFFWNKCQQQGNPKGLDASYFAYPGMKPQTKETAILMLVDAIEAASRTLERPTRESIESMVQRLIYTKLASGQLDDCALDLSDLRVIINKMVDTLVSQHHHRIKYQWQVEQAEEFGVPSHAVRPSSPPEMETGPPFTVPPGIALGRGNGSEPELPRAWVDTLPSAPGEVSVEVEIGTEPGITVREKSAVYDRGSASDDNVRPLHGGFPHLWRKKKSDPGG